MNAAGMDRLVRKVDGFVKEIFPLIDQATETGEAVDLVPHLTRIVLRTAGVFVLGRTDAVSSYVETLPAKQPVNDRPGTCRSQAHITNPATSRSKDQLGP